MDPHESNLVIINLVIFYERNGIYLFNRFRRLNHSVDTSIFLVSSLVISNLVLSHNEGS